MCYDFEDKEKGFKYHEVFFWFISLQSVELNIALTFIPQCLGVLFHCWQWWFRGFLSVLE